MYTSTQKRGSIVVRVICRKKYEMLNMLYGWFVWPSCRFSSQDLLTSIEYRYENHFFCWCFVIWFLCGDATKNIWYSDFTLNFYLFASLWEFYVVNSSFTSCFCLFFLCFQFISSLKDNLNAEVALGTVTNVKEACAWLGYTYLFIRMRQNPLAYGIGWDEVLFSLLISIPLSSTYVLAMSDANKRCFHGVTLFNWVILLILLMTW